MDMMTCQMMLQGDVWRDAGTTALSHLVALCPGHEETLWELLTDPNHWVLEVVIMVVFDGLVGALLWPFIKRHWKHHLYHDEQHQETKS